MAEDKDSRLKGAATTTKSTVEEQKVKSPESKAKEPPLLNNLASSSAPQKSRRGPVWLALLIALGGLFAAGYNYWSLQQYQQISQEKERFSEPFDLEDIRRQMENRTAEVETRLERYRDQSNSQREAVDELRAQVVDVRGKIGEISHVSRKSWMLAEAEYLLRLANQRLMMEQEVTSALALLQSADQILLDVGDVNLFRVRAEIAKEVMALRAVGEPDIEGAFLSLAALSDQLSSLPLLSPRSKLDTELDPAPETEPFQDVLAHLEKLVTIRHREQPVAPLLPPEQHYYVQQNLRLMLEQAQLALLQRKPLLYIQSLAKAEQWVQDYFEFNASNGSLLESLADLKQLNIAPQLPDISKSLALLKSYLSNPELLPTDNSTNNAGVAP